MRKIISIILSLVLVMTLFVGCTENTNNPSKNAGTNVSSETDDVNSTNSEDDIDDSTDDDNSNKNSSNNNTNNNNVGGVNGSTTNSTTTIETDIPYQFPTPGTENWSDSEDAVVLTVGNESIGKFSYNSWYFMRDRMVNYKNYTDEEKELFCKMIFEDQKVNLVNVMVQLGNYYTPGKGYNIDYFKKAYAIGEGAFMDVLIECNIPIMITMGKMPTYWAGENEFVREECAPEVAKVIANLIYDLRVECGLNVVFSSLNDEPDWGVEGDAKTSMVVNHYKYVLPLLREELDSRGMDMVQLTGMEICHASTATNYPILYDEVKDNLFAFTFHDAGGGNIRQSLMQQMMFYNIGTMQTSTCPVMESYLAGDCFTTKSNGDDTIADYYMAMILSSSLLKDVNMGVDGIATWSPLETVKSLAELDGEYTETKLVYYNSDMFTDGFCTTAAYDYYAQILGTVSPGAEIYQCSNSLDGTMDGQFNESYLSASAGINADGSWGINIFNKTDDVYSVVGSGFYKAKSAKTITINLDIVGLYGTGAQEFDIYASNPQGYVNEKIGTIVLVDGRGTIDVYPTELISLRSVSKTIGLNNKPLPITEEIKDLNIICAGESYALMGGNKVELKSTPTLTNNFDSVVYVASDFSKILNADYEFDGKTAKIWNEQGMIILTVDSDTIQFVGNVNGNYILNSKPYVKDGELYFELSQSVAGSLGTAFGTQIIMYAKTGLLVVGEHNIVNIGRFAKLFS